MKSVSSTEAQWSTIAENNKTILDSAPSVARASTEAAARCEQTAAGWRALTHELKVLPTIVHKLSLDVSAACAQCEALEARLLEATIACAELREARWRANRLREAEEAEAAAERAKAEAQRRAEAEERRRAEEARRAEAKRLAKEEEARIQKLQAEFEAQRKAHLEAAAAASEAARGTALQAAAMNGASARPAGGGSLASSPVHREYAHRLREVPSTPPRALHLASIPVTPPRADAAASALESAVRSLSHGLGSDQGVVGAPPVVALGAGAEEEDLDAFYLESIEDPDSQPLAAG